MRTVDAYVEAGVQLAADLGTAAWSFDLDAWGCCGQGPDEASAIANLASLLAVSTAEVRIAERIRGDELAFVRDCWAANEAQRATTLAILSDARIGVRALATGCPAEVLDFDNPARKLPRWARWRTVRQMLWHVADTDCRYYLPGLGLESRPRAGDIDSELDECESHVRRVVSTMPVGASRRHGNEVWTSTKVLRRLAWHERAELRAMRDLASANAEALGLRLELPNADTS